MDNDKTSAPLASVAFSLYSVSVAVFVCYFNWQYAQSHGFWAWIMFGEVIATLKAIFWPIYVFVG